ncbi:hypothetical protein DFH09DRAFT_1366011 [Mycena vulgaris]|nr:hypothetical protein DFH09DRAFT_1366011 [Mycena vulgaris]
MFLLLGHWQPSLFFNHITQVVARFTSRPYVLPSHRRRDTLHPTPSMDQESAIHTLCCAAERALRPRSDRSYLAKATNHVLRIATSDEDHLQRLIDIGDLGLETVLFLKLYCIVLPPFDAPTVQRALVDSIAALLKTGAGFPTPTTFQPFSLFTAILGVLIEDNGLGGKRTATNLAAEIEGGIGADQLASLTKQYSMLGKAVKGLEAGLATIADYASTLDAQEEEGW